ncbi:hypothetical protein QCA50_003951 [Cerrena zonata]|uniref:BTB domain-containing protein n=1 Tax=Cerrena zonata TaxID=2478898 RepID=A0AAW0GRZ6_9APHY
MDTSANEHGAIDYPLSSNCEDFLNDVMATNPMLNRKDDVHSGSPGHVSFASNLEAWQSTTRLPCAIITSAAFSASCDYGEGRGDVVLISRDAVHFYVRRSRLLNASHTNFASLLLLFISHDTTSEHVSPCITLTEDANILEIVLHVIYGTPYQQEGLDLGTLLEVIGTLHKYGIPLDTHVVLGQPLFEGIALQMHQDALKVYIVAAQYDLFEMASIASSYLLNYPLVFLPKGTTSKLGPAYLHMLYSLQLARVYLLQRILTIAPEGHEPTVLCGRFEHEVVKSAWWHVTTDFASSAHADVSTAEIREALYPVLLPLICAECQNSVQRRIDEAVLRWSRTPRTISRDMCEFYTVLA